MFFRPISAVPQKTTYQEGYMPGEIFQHDGPQYVAMSRDIRFASDYTKKYNPGFLLPNVPPPVSRTFYEYSHMGR